jgi:hypothetical protein
MEDFMKLIATFLLLVPIIGHAGCREPIYIGKPAADEVTKRNYDNCMKAETPRRRVQQQSDLINEQRLKMQQIEQQQGLKFQ